MVHVMLEMNHKKSKLLSTDSIPYVTRSEKRDRWDYLVDRDFLVWIVSWTSAECVGEGLKC